MARPLRIEYEGALYHITARGNERKSIFFTETDFDKFLHYVSEAQKKYGIEILCYVLMDNHYHLIVSTPEANLSRAMQYINGSYTKYINVKRKRCGHLFQGRYKAILVDRDNYLLELSRYIHLNPVRAGIVQNPDNYKRSSYKTYITNKVDKIVTQDQVLKMISDDKSLARKEYKRFVDASIGHEQDDPLKGVYGGIILGRTGFIKETLSRIKVDILQKEEISHTKALRTVYRVEEILDFVSDFYNIRKEEIIKNKYTKPRKLAIYLIKTNTGATNKEIGEIFGRIHSTTVSKIYERFSNELKNDRKLKKEIIKVVKALSHVEN